LPVTHSIIGAFAFPTLLYMGLILFIFTASQQDENQPLHKPPYQGHILFPLLQAAGIALIALFFYQTIAKDGYALAE